MAMAAAGIGPGDEVIVPAISFVSSATAVSRAGATPVFVDIEPYSFNIDPERAEAAVTPKTKAIMPVHFGGPMANMDRLMRLARERAFGVDRRRRSRHGTEWNGKRWSFGVCGAFSFQNSKVMTAGEAGSCSRMSRIRRARSSRPQGRQTGQGWFYHYTLGSNYRITALQAAVLLAQLERLPQQIETRRRSEELLRSELASVSGLVFQEVLPQVNTHSTICCWAASTRASSASRDELHRALSAQGIPCTPFYPHTLYGNPLYQKGGCRVEPCPVAEACIYDAFWLPIAFAGERAVRELRR
jgi:dTDP-4-amino-4,6-dideoxygalactose transaminase